MIGPITTPASPPDATTAGAATAVARGDEIFVSVQDDADRSSYASIDVATDPGGP